jgi:predicted RNA-binding Zn-ribbon protein involved in translation (DUF1610 family)
MSEVDDVKRDDYWKDEQDGWMLGEEYEEDMRTICPLCGGSAVIRHAARLYSVCWQCGGKGYVD